MKESPSNRFEAIRLRQVWSTDGITGGSGSSIVGNANDQLICGSGVFLHFLLPEELPFYNFALQ